MRKRGQDSEAVIAAVWPPHAMRCSHFKEFDYVIVNEVFETAVDDVRHLHRQPPATTSTGGPLRRADPHPADGVICPAPD
jgi:guanylate kinase